MASHNDIKDILNIPITPTDTYVSKKMLFSQKKPKVKKAEPAAKRPEGMARELWGLIINDNSEPSLLTGMDCGYKRQKAKIGQSQVRKWKWTSFTNSARQDNAQFSHWARDTTDPDQEYAFAHFNKKIELPEYTEDEYEEHLKTINDGVGVSCTPWTRCATDSLMELCRCYDARFPVIADRWDCDTYGIRTVEELKQRYYDICNVITRLRYPSNHPKVQSIREYDGEHEKKRKLQLEKMWSRTEEMIDEEEYLSAELKKIDIRKKEREKKTRDLQKMISAADVAEPKKMTSDRGRKVAGSGTTGPFGRQTTAPRGVGRPSTTGVGRPPNQSAGQAAGIKAIAAMRKNSNSGGGGGPNAPRGSRFKKNEKADGTIKKDETALSSSATASNVVSLVVTPTKKASTAAMKPVAPVIESQLSFLTCSVTTLIDILPDGSFKNADKFNVHGINYQDQRSAGIALISNKLKLPTSIGQKKIKEIEQNLIDVDVVLKPISTEDVIEIYNELRSDSMTLQQLKNNLSSSTYELESVHQLMTTFKKKTKNSTPKQKPKQKAIATPTTTPTVVTHTLVTPTTTGSKIPKTPSPEKKPMDIEALNKKLDKLIKNRRRRELLGEDIKQKPKVKL